MIYLDHNATTPVLPEVFEAMRPYFCEEWGNPSSSYRFGSKLKRVLEEARGAVADLIGAQAREIIFTSCGTESNNTAIHSALMARPGRKHIVTSQVEHSSVLTYCQGLEACGYRVTYLPVDREGLLSLADLENAITDETAVVSLMWANNETGVLFPVGKIGEVCRSRDVPFHCDAVQTIGKMSIDVASLPVDFLSLTGHKLNAPKGIGALYASREMSFSPLIAGGHQERGRRGGTENVPLIVGLGEAAASARKKLSLYEKAVRPLRDRLEDKIMDAIPGTERNGHKTERLPNTSNLTFPGVESEATLLLLDQAGICASSGSACLADSDEPSHVVKAMKSNSGASRHMIRFSFGIQNTTPQVDRTIDAMKRIIASLKPA